MSLLFVSNNLLDPQKINNLAPVQFISFAKMKAKMYTLRIRKKTTKYDDVFTISTKHYTKIYGTQYVYGAIFSIRDFDYFISGFDAYHLCSMSTLYKNHIKDMQHRKVGKVTLIQFNTLEQFARQLYKEFMEEDCWYYTANPKHSKIQQVALETKNRNRRIQSGINKPQFLKLWSDVNASK